ncbi:hypothetical protein Tco_0860427 [Tanacetum coccineum]|uniref:Reverse transcriptase Ty1/copia-type domain-containing protein n=1 Tax=Tanacetum coccineum TaxID=301880 RepID=A0ABQ5BEW3_9ASTR
MSEKDDTYHDTILDLEAKLKKNVDLILKLESISKDIKEMKDVFESTKSELDELEKQNDLLKDQLLEASLKHDVELMNATSRVRRPMSRYSHVAHSVLDNSKKATKNVVQIVSSGCDKADEFNQEDSADFDGNAQFVPYNPPSREEIESSTMALEPSNVQNFHQVQPSTHIWTKDHPLDQVIGDPSKPVMTRQRLHTDSEVCMYALTVSTIEPKNIKEAMADHSWIESMQDERNITIFQMDIKTAISQGPFEKRSLCQPSLKAFIDPEFPDHRLDAYLQGTLLIKDLTVILMEAYYLTAFDPYIAFATFVCARYQARPTVKHLKEVKRIFWYMRQSYKIGLWYPKDSGFELIAYSDTDHAGCKDDCKSTSGGLQFLGGNLVSWSSKKQDCTAMSTAKAEYVSLSACCAQVIWMHTQLLDYGYKYNQILMYCDSKSAIAISCNPV